MNKLLSTIGSIRKHQLQGTRRSTVCQHKLRTGAFVHEDENVDDHDVMMMITRRRKKTKTTSTEIVVIIIIVIITIIIMTLMFA